MQVAVASGKGGTGKTTVATHLATALAATAAVVLVDLDVEEPNAALFVRGDPVRTETRHKQVPVWTADACTACGLCRDVCAFNAVLKLPDEVMIFPQLCHACFACSELCPAGALPMTPRPMGELRHLRTDRLDLVESRLLVGEEQAVPLIRQTLSYLDDHVPPATLRILDAPPGTSCSMVEATRSADLVLLVTEPTPFGLHDLTLAVQTVRALDRPCAVVINRVGLGDDRVEAYCRAEDLTVVARIPHSRTVAETYAGGSLVGGSVPAFAAAVGSIADYVREHARQTAP